MTTGPFTAAWGDDIRPQQPEPPTEPEPIQLVADGYYWLTYDGPTGFPGLPVEVNGEFYFIPGYTTRFVVEKVTKMANGKFTSIYPPLEPQP